MIGLLIAIVGAGAFLGLGEWLHKTFPHRVGPEFTRKSVHITIGTFAAFWPFFISWSYIELLSLLFFLVVLLAHKTKWFKSIYSVSRKTWGDLFFAMAIGLTALVGPDKWTFTAAILSMSLADGFAALIGQAFGHDNRYKVFGYTKSIAGTATFYVLSLVIVGVCAVGFGNSSWTTLLWVPFVAAGLENVGVAGVDNLLVPVFLAIFLN